MNGVFDVSDAPPERLASLMPPVVDSMMEFRGRFCSVASEEFEQLYQALVVNRALKRRGKPYLHIHIAYISRRLSNRFQRLENLTPDRFPFKSESQQDGLDMPGLSTESVDIIRHWRLANAFYGLAELSKVILN
jgi:hypothetical protein